jgi:hypothetical protein
MSEIRERTLLARCLLLETALAALVEAGAVDPERVEARRAEIDARPDALSWDQVLDTRAGLGARLEQTVRHAREQRVEARAMRDRATAMRDTAERQMDDAYEALALLTALDDALFE